ncbi:MAG TPA: hypothetical protein VFR70_05115, partial [Flavobacterium sp.]|nr:hypothetical protein [Flavobacterium sp.]
MKKNYILKFPHACLFLLIFVTGICANAQVGIGTTSPEAALEVKSGDSGMLIPRIALTATDVAAPIAEPTTSELVYNTNTAGSGNTAVTPGYYYWSTPSGPWVRLIAGADAAVAGDNLGNHTATAALNMNSNNIVAASAMGIGTSAPASALEVVSGNSGILIPRVKLTATNVIAPITTPTASELVYNTDTAGSGATAVTPGYYYLSSASGPWVRLVTGGDAEQDWNLTGNANTNSNSNFIGTKDSQDLAIRTNNTEKMRITSAGNIRIGGTANPTEKLEINAGNIFLNSAAGQFIRWSASSGVQAPTFSTRSIGTRLVLWPGVSATATDFALGIDANTIWQGVPQNNDTFSHKFYAGTTP